MQKDLKHKNFKETIQSKGSKRDKANPNHPPKNKIGDVQTNVHPGRPAAPGAKKETYQEVVTTESIVQELLAEGLTLDQIVMPGGAKDVILFIADDFDAPLEEFADYM